MEVKPFRLAKFPTTKPKKKAGIRQLVPDVNGQKNPVYFNPNNPNHTHGRAGIKFHYNPLQHPKTEPTLDRGRQTLGNPYVPSIEDYRTHTEPNDTNAV